MPYFKDLASSLHFLSVEDVAAGGAQYLPAGCVAITAADAAIIQHPPLSLAEAQTAARAVIDAEAGAARARYITTATGQEATYLLKADDADRYKASGYPDAQIASYPWVLARAKALTASPAAADYQAAADLIITTRDAWVLKGAAIEEARERGKAAVAAAVDVAGVETARAAAVAELVAL